MVVRAAMDVGTNSCRLLLAEIENGRIMAEERRVVTTRIGKGIADSGRLDPEGKERTLACLHDFSLILQEKKVKQYQLVGTNALREAKDGYEFADQVKVVTGLNLRIISGEEEAELSYAGVTRGLSLEHPPLVADLGGGSTEFICYDQVFRLRVSLPLGVVRAYDGDWKEKDIFDRLAPLGPHRQQLEPYPLVMVGGTATTLAAIDLKMEQYDWKLIQGHQLSRQRVKELYRQLAILTLEERKRLPGLLPDRADIIPYGALIVVTMMHFLNYEVLTVADTDLLTALLWVD